MKPIRFSHSWRASAARHAAAQDDIPLAPSGRTAGRGRADRRVQPSARARSNHAAKSTVRVWSGKRRLAYGTVIGDGRKILTKWSEVARARGNLRVESPAARCSRRKIPASMRTRTSPLLEITGQPLTPVQWSLETPTLGAFLAAPQPDGRPAAFGVVSVLERNLRETDHAYLGVIGDPGFAGPGVKIEEVTPESGAAAAGLKPGDIILKVGERPISGLLELKNSLVGVEPGRHGFPAGRSERRGENVEVLLGNRPDLPKYPRRPPAARWSAWAARSAGCAIRSPSVIQTDMRPQAGPDRRPGGGSERPRRGHHHGAGGPHPFVRHARRRGGGPVEKEKQETRQPPKCGPEEKGSSR